MRPQQTFYLLRFCAMQRPRNPHKFESWPSLNYITCVETYWCFCVKTHLWVCTCVQSHVNMLLQSQAFSSAASRHTWRGKTHTPIGLCWDFQLVTDLPQTYFLHPLMHWMHNPLPPEMCRRESEQKMSVKCWARWRHKDYCCLLLLIQVYCVSASYVANFVLTTEMHGEWDWFHLPAARVGARRGN